MLTIILMVIGMTILLVVEMIILVISEFRFLRNNSKTLARVISS